MRLFGPPKKGWFRDVRTWIAAGFVAYALFGFFGVPWIIRLQLPRLARTYLHREASLRAAAFNPFSFRAQLDGFELKDRDASPLAAFDELVVDFQLSSAYRRAWTFRQIRLVRPKVVARIGSDGRPTAADLFESKPEPDKPKKEFKLPRVLIRDLTIDSGTFELRDQTTAPPFDSTWEPLSLRIGDFTTIPAKSGDGVLTVGIEGRGEARWSGHMSIEPLRFEGKLDLAFRTLDRVWQYAGRAYPILVTTGETHVSVPYLFEKRPDGVMRLDVHDVAFDTSGVGVRPRDAKEDWARFGRIELSGGRVLWPERTAEVAQVRIVEPSAHVWRSEDGHVNWLDLFDRIKETLASSSAKSAGDAPPWKATCHVVDVVKGAVDVEDRAVTPSAKLVVSELESHVENVTSEPSSALTTKLSAKVNGSATTTTTGTVVIRPPAVDVDVEFAGFDIKALQPYLAQYVNAQLQSGAASLRGKLSYRDGGKPIMTFDGRTALDGFSLAEPGGHPVLSWDGVAVESIHLTLAPNQFKAKSIEIKKPFAQLLIDRERKLEAMKLVKSRPPDADSPPKAEGASKSAVDAFPFEIASIRIHDAGVEYGDESLLLPFHTHVHDGEGSLTDLSSKSAAGSKLLFEGKVDEHGYAKTEGTLRVFDPFAASDLHVLFRNLEMTSLTPYTAEFAGYSIKEGRLDLAVDYQIHNRSLVGNHKVTATQLTLGDKVSGAKTSLPLRLAVALLKDKDGKIDLDVPIEGSVDDPEFGYRKVIWSAFKTMVVNVTTAPFHFLGRLFGVKGEDLEIVSFEAGRSVLLPPEQEKLGKLVQAMTSRPGLVLEVGGRFDTDADGRALRQAKLDELIASRREAMGGADIDAVLEALYTEAFSAEALQALRGKHVSPDPAPPPETATKKSKKPGTAPPGPPPGFDPAGYFDEIRAELLKRQSVGVDELKALAKARSDAIVAALTGPGGIEASRVTASEIEERKKKEGQNLVASQLSMPKD